MSKKAILPPAEPINLRDFIEYAEDAVISKTLIASGKAGTVTLFSFAAGQGLSEHTAPYDALAQIVEGEAEITIGDKTTAVRAGEMILLPASIPHALQAAQAFKMLLVMIKGGESESRD